jgi:tetraacyldisaccharide 4'-kinase
MVVGGSGKTPVVAALARNLIRLGHRPAILSRGYGRTSPSSDVIVVSDGTGPRVSVEESGDEPQMLARDLKGAPVIVSANRFRAGMAAIDRFDASVLILDDGFQHLQLARTVDLLVLSAGDLADQVLPAGRLREPLTAARAADAVLVYGDAQQARQVANGVGIPQSFFVARQVLSLCPLSESAPVPPMKSRVAAVAGIARPERFLDTLRQTHEIASQFVFADHYWFTADDVHNIERHARELGAGAVVTTAKDAVRLEQHRAGMSLPWAILPIEVSIEPGGEFESWLRQRLSCPP